MSNALTSYNDSSKSKTIFNMIIGVSVSLIVSLVLILLFALLIKWFDWSDGVIMPANIIIKVISISIGIIFVTKDGQKGALRGSILGIAYIALCFVVFSILNGAFSFGLPLLYDLLLGVISGAILGIIAVNIRK